MLSKDETIQQATFAYIDDVYVNNSMVPAEQVRQHLSQFGLKSNDPEHLKNGTQVFGLDVCGSMAFFSESEEIQF